MIFQSLLLNALFIEIISIFLKRLEDFQSLNFSLSNYIRKEFYNY